MYREGKVSTGSALTTDSYVPKETTKAVVTEEETTTKETETEESEELKPSETGRDGNIIDEFPDMTDENGELLEDQTNLRKPVRAMDQVKTQDQAARGFQQNLVIRNKLEAMLLEG